MTPSKEKIDLYTADRIPTGQMMIRGEAPGISDDHISIFSNLPRL